MDGYVNINGSIAGSTFNVRVTETADNADAYEVPLPVGTAAASYAQTSTVIGVVTLTEGHGLATGVYDAYWTESGVKKIAVGCTGTISDTNTLTLTAAISQDDFPAADPGDMVVCEQVIINTAIDGDAVAMYTVTPIFTSSTETSDCSVDFHDASHNQITTLRLTANQPSLWWTGMSTCPMTGNPITHCHASNQSTTNAATLKIGVLADSTP